MRFDSPTKSAWPLGAGIAATAMAVAVAAAPPQASGTGAGVAASRGPVATGDGQFFESRVRPLLVQRCGSCHGAKIAQGGLSFATPAALRKGGESGPAVVPGKPDESRLIAAVRWADPKLRMPPAAKLPDAEVAILVEWISKGAPFPEPAATRGASSKSGPLSLAEGRNWWAFRPLRAPEPAAVRRAGWPRTRVDRYLLARMEQARLTPSPEADARTLIRRLSFDLTGLPPTPEEVEQFVSDTRSEAGQKPSKFPTAYERLLERLLASPQYGERWGRHWLDLVRYCDVPEAWAQSDAQAWLYRDWVVSALNADLPYDRFVQRQIAADLLPDTAPTDLAALGLLGLSPTYWKELKLAPDVIKAVVAEEWEERIGTVGGAIMGLTVACARCHDHKQDPISQKDYYALAGVFASIRQAPRPMLPPEQGARVMAAREKVKGLEAEALRLDQAAKAEKDAVKAATHRSQAAEARARITSVRSETPGIDAPLAYAVEDAALQVLPDGTDRTRLSWNPGQGQDIALHLRGNPAREGGTVTRRFLSVLSQGEPRAFVQGSGRRELAEALFREGAPLSARVMVNRVWRHHFGRGLVETPSNFGTTGDRPTHPELLDDLATRFVRSGWSLKWLHREIVLSAAYRQSSAVLAANPSIPHSALRTPHLVDPENRLLARMTRRRLEVEAWRDSILAAAGTLDRQMGGEPQELSSPSHRRRTLYGLVRRRDLDDLLRLYDFPDPTMHVPARFPTTTPLQQLYVLNSPFLGTQASALAKRVMGEATDTEGRIRRAYRLLFGREPRLRELAAGRDYLGAEGGADASGVRWQQYAEVLLAGNELMFID